MTDHSDLITWLLDSPTPSLRYLTLRHLLARPETDAEVQAAREAMQTTGPIPLILAKQTSAGNWEGDLKYYGPKYVGTHWSLILLTELAADPDDPRLGYGVDFMLAHPGKNFMLEDRFDATIPSPDQFGWTCFWGNVLRYAVYGHRENDPRLQPIINYLVRNLETGGCHCIYNQYLPCAWGAVRTLWGLAALPQRSEAVTAAINRTLDFLLSPDHHLATGDYPTSGVPHKMWSKLNFPLFYQVDVLFTLRVLGELNALGHPAAQPALAWLEAQRQPNGRWRGTSPYASRTWKIPGDRQDTNRWVSLHAAIILQQAQKQALAS